MPSKNTIKEFDIDSYYHVYNRGVEKRNIFIDEQDYSVFLNLIKRYLSGVRTKDGSGREYEWLGEELELTAFCLMPNHFHLLLYQVEPEAITKLMRNVCTAYVMYFNKKYKRVGGLFQGVYKASLVTQDSYLQHITRYIHLNPDDYLGWEWSSLAYYLNYKDAEWLHEERLLEPRDRLKYLEFVEDYKSYKATLDEVKKQLAI